MHSHLHTIIEECTLVLISIIEYKIEKRVKFVLPNNQAKIRVTTNKLTCGEKFELNPTFGCFTLQENETTIAIGKILR
jgi:translation elongation factor EF-1alpha